MLRFLIGGVVLGGCMLATFAQSSPVRGEDPRDATMRFEWRREGPADVCGKSCRVWISAVGAITADTPAEFDKFVKAQDKNKDKAHDVQGATLALDSSGGSVLGAIALGREIRQLDMTTTVGRTIELRGNDSKDPRARLSPRADCESMCAFVLLAGTRRFVPPEAQVLVHQIWLGDKRNDAKNATYSAEDLALVQHDVGQLASYTVEMGGEIELFEIALRVPPWQPLHTLTRTELRRTHLQVGDDGVDGQAPGAAATPTNGARVSAIGAAAHPDGDAKDRPHVEHSPCLSTASRRRC